MDILVVEDDLYIGSLLVDLLKQKYHVHRAFSGTEANLELTHNHYDLVLLDLMLPGMTGEELLDKYKNKVKIIILSAKASKEDRVSNLLNGACDYITKPFDNDELLARIEVQLRTKTVNSNIITINGLTIDLDLHQASINGNDLRLTKLEFGLLEFLMKNPNKVYSKSQLFEAVWNFDSLGTEDSVKVHISSIRSKIEKYSDYKYIETIWGIGFKFVKE